ncbi:hypothetical protein [Ruania alba]|uniref:Uncharacterized protein n=1 Tax=Ruania alba TaxID=648782 RepID=A0A1H5MH34_9MICO|nr:hypothetical protein [Ruania alba]SEE88655.1 hypothetical protein SAMN04488554_3391 [Ruania alba]
MPQRRERIRFAVGVALAPGLAALAHAWVEWLSPHGVVGVLMGVSIAAVVVIVATVVERRTRARMSPDGLRRRERANIAAGWGMIVGGFAGILASFVGMPWFELREVALVVIAGGGAGLVSGARARLARLESAM